jgi:hypothetical protein
MWLNQTCRDADLCIDKTLVQAHDSATAGCPDLDVIIVVAREVVDTPHLHHHSKRCA